MFTYLRNLKSLKSHLISAEKKMANDQDFEENTTTFVEILRRICALTREAEANHATLKQEDWILLISQIEAILSDAVDFAYGEHDAFDFLPSYSDDKSHCPIVEDEFCNSSCGMSAFKMEEFMKIFGLSLKNVKAGGGLPQIPPADKVGKPHDLSSRIARYRTEAVATARSIDAGSRARNIYQARCESFLYDSFTPVGRLCIAESDGCLAMLGCTGYKQRDPALDFFDITDSDEMFSTNRELGFQEVAYQSVMDETNRLLAIADGHRIKTMEWSDNVGEERRLINKHTLKSPGKGPMVIMGQTLIRAGANEAYTYDLSTAPTHGSKGKKVIGKAMDGEDLDTWRDEPDNIEMSSGSKHNGTIAFATGVKPPEIWTPAPCFTPSTVLSAQLARSMNLSPTVFALDFESQNQIAAKYLGHGGGLLDISLSHGSPNTFITACGDGYTRLFDKRHVLPVMTFNATNLSSFCQSALSINPDGLPLVITDSNEAIKVWDVRAKSIVYELATGNNNVQSMIWDGQRDTLYAAVECSNKNRLGDFMDYRKAKIPARYQIPGEEWEMDSEEYEDEDDMWEGRCWPSRARHDEVYFDYAFDAGRDGILRHQFKSEPDSKILPAYGDADMRRGGGFW